MRRPPFHGWFVVRNRCDDDADDPDFDLRAAEDELFAKPPWSRIRAERRGSTMLKTYLGNLLCAKIGGAFPRLQAKVLKLLAEAKAARANLGEARTSTELQQQYLHEILQRYTEAARLALCKPGDLPNPAMRVRGLVRHENEKFTDGMRAGGHRYEFEGDDGMDCNACVDVIVDSFGTKLPAPIFAAGGFGSPFNAAPVTPQRTPSRTTPELMVPGGGRARSASPSPPSSSRQAADAERQAASRQQLLETIRRHVNMYRSTELPGMPNPDVVPPMYRLQTANWETIATRHLDDVSGLLVGAARALLEHACPPRGHRVLHEALTVLVEETHHRTQRAAADALRAFCESDRSNPPQTTNPVFAERLRLLQMGRLFRNLAVSRKLIDDMVATSVPGGPEQMSKAEMARRLFDQCHYSADENAVYEVHDALKVYYDVSHLPP